MSDMEQDEPYTVTQEALDHIDSHKAINYLKTLKEALVREADGPGENAEIMPQLEIWRDGNILVGVFLLGLDRSMILRTITNSIAGFDADEFLLYQEAYARAATEAEQQRYETEGGPMWQPGQLAREAAEGNTDVIEMMQVTYVNRDDLYGFKTMPFTIDWATHIVQWLPPDRSPSVAAIEPGVKIGGAYANAIRVGFDDQPRFRREASELAKIVDFHDEEEMRAHQDMGIIRAIGMVSQFPLVINQAHGTEKQQEIRVESLKRMSEDGTFNWEEVYRND